MFIMGSNAWIIPRVTSNLAIRNELGTAPKKLVVKVTPLNVTKASAGFCGLSTPTNSIVKLDIPVNVTLVPPTTTEEPDGAVGVPLPEFETGPLPAAFTARIRTV